jgi:hypothetical protein
LKRRKDGCSMTKEKKKATRRRKCERGGQDNEAGKVI